MVSIRRYAAQSLGASPPMRLGPWDGPFATDSGTPASLRERIGSQATRVPGFWPGTCGFHFPNDPPSIPYKEVTIDFPWPGQTTIPVGNMSNGICGGMAFAARDYFDAGVSPWGSDVPDADGTPIHNEFPSDGTTLSAYLVDRLFASFNLPGGPTKYLKWMNPAIRDTEPNLPDWMTGEENRAALMLDEFETVKDTVDRGNPCPLGLIMIKSTNPAKIGENHQVLAYGYEEWGDGDHAAILVYDPNYPGDEVRIEFDLRDPSHWLNPRSSKSDPIHAFFTVDYDPPSATSGPWSAPPTEWR